MKRGVMTTPTLEQAIADARQYVTEAKRLRDDRLAKLLEDVIEPIARAAAPYTTWLGESDAMLHSGCSRDTLRRRFAALAQAGDARWSQHGRRTREYRQCALPRRPRREALRADAQADAWR